MEQKGMVEARMQELNVVLPECASLQVGMLERARRVGDLVFVSGHGPATADGTMAYHGRLGTDLTVEQGAEAARLCTLNCLAAVKELVGTLDQIEQVVRLRGFVSSSSEFYRQPEVMNGASSLLIELFGDAGRHARTAIGTSVLPGNIPVEVDMVVKVEGT